jgi:transcriptional regulator
MRLVLVNLPVHTTNASTGDAFMYMTSHFEEKRIDVLHRFIAEHPLGALVTLCDAGLEANHVPFELDAQAGRHGTLNCHVARNNPVWRDARTDADALVIFQGPSAYVSPTWYPSKQLTHRVVPTYNYAVVHAYGRIVVHDDPKWLRGLLARLTRTMEAGVSATPWKMGDAPADFIEQMIGQVVGIEIGITRIAGKWKVSQNRSAEDRAGASAGLRSVATAESIAIADLIDRAAE